MLIQPLIENSVKHGITSEKPIIKLHFENSDTYIVCSIKDNGKGLGNTLKPQQSQGMDLVKERIRLLNLNSKNKISLNYLNEDENSQGVHICLEIPKSA